jgi:hypothetical protein
MRGLVLNIVVLLLAISCQRMPQLTDGYVEYGTLSIVAEYSDPQVVLLTRATTVEDLNYTLNLRINENVAGQVEDKYQVVHSDYSKLTAVRVMSNQDITFTLSANKNGGTANNYVAWDAPSFYGEVTTPFQVATDTITKQSVTLDLTNAKTTFSIGSALTDGNFKDDYSLVITHVNSGKSITYTKDNIANEGYLEPGSNLKWKFTIKNRFNYSYELSGEQTIEAAKHYKFYFDLETKSGRVYKIED